MADVETRFPDWACHVALALFAGIRPVELVKLAQAVAANGTDAHFSDSAIVLPEDISRGEGRRSGDHSQSRCMVGKISSYTGTDLPEKRPYLRADP